MGSRKRKHGLQGSREKLDKAMLAAGLQSQMALAIKIAQSEGLQKPPKDLVSKVFRGVPVTQFNFSRIAKALNVEMYTLFLTQDDLAVKDQKPNTDNIKPTPNGEDTEQQSANRKDIIEPSSSSLSSHANDNETGDTPKKKSTLLTLPRALIITITVGLLYLLSTLTLFTDSVDNTNTKVEAPLGFYRVVLDANEPGKLLAQELNNNLSQTDEITSILISKPSETNLQAAEILNTWQAHVAINISIVNGEFYSQIHVAVDSKQHSAILLQRLVRKAELPLIKDEISESIIAQLRLFLDGETLSSPAIILKSTFESYAQGMELLFIGHAGDEVNEAINQFSAIINTDPEFAPAHANLCKAYVRSSWVTDEADLLEKALLSCEQAKKLAPYDIQYITAYSELLTRTGRINEAIELLDNFVLLTSLDADALAVKSEAYYEVFRQNYDEKFSKLSQSYGQKALSIDPTHWRANNTLGNLYFLQGKIEKALDNFLQVSSRIQHEVTLANIGTLQLCLGKLDDATNTYLTIINTFESNYVGHEQLGNAYYFQNEYQLALEQALISISKLPEVSIHQIFNSAALAYLGLGDKQKSTEYFQKALALIERDELLNNDNISSSLYKLYYTTKLLSIADEFEVTNDFNLAVTEFLDHVSVLDLKARNQLVWLLAMANIKEEANTLWQKISAVCPVYSKSSEIKALLNN